VIFEVATASRLRSFTAGQFHPGKNILTDRGSRGPTAWISHRKSDRYYRSSVCGKERLCASELPGSAATARNSRSLNVRNLGVGDYADVISGVDALIAKGWVDKDACSMGWSQGVHFGVHHRVERPSKAVQ